LFILRETILFNCATSSHLGKFYRRVTEILHKPDDDYKGLRGKLNPYFTTKQQRKKSEDVAKRQLLVFKTELFNSPELANKRKR